jgi:hypothetical protein
MIVVLLVGACTAPAASPSPVPSSSMAAVTPSPAAAPTATPRPPATAAVSPTHSFILPSPASSPFAPDLEARLPTELRGIPLIRGSAPLSIFAGGSDMCIIFCADEPKRLEAASGVDLDKIRFAMAVPPDDSGLAVQIIALQFPGLATKKLIPSRLKAGGHSDHRPVPPDVRALRAGDEEVTWVQWMPLFPEANQVEYLFARNDVLYIINGLLPEGDVAPADVTLAVEALARL